MFYFAFMPKHWIHEFKRSMLISYTSIQQIKLAYSANLFTTQWLSLKKFHKWYIVGSSGLRYEKIDLIIRLMVGFWRYKKTRLIVGYWRYVYKKTVLLGLIVGYGDKTLGLWFFDASTLAAEESANR